MKYFDVKSRGTFYMEVKECVDIANLTESFTTEEKINELSEDKHWGYNSRIYFTYKIRAAIEEWILLIPPNALSTTLKSSNVRILLNEVNTDRLRQYAPQGYSVKGTRLYNTTNCESRINYIEEKKREAEKLHQKLLDAQPYERPQNITTSDKYTLGGTIRKTIFDKYGVNISHYSNSGSGFYGLAKRLLNWPELKREIRKNKKLKEYVQDIIWMKKIWDNPESVNRL